jgi:hypothetical protein
MGFRSMLRLCVLASLIGASLAESDARAQPKLPQPPAVPTPPRPDLADILTCSTIPADKTLTFPAISWGVREEGGTYGSQFCDAFVVDVVVTSESARLPAGASMVIKFQNLIPNWELIRPKDKASCEASSVLGDFYRKADGETKFTRLFRWTPTLVWMGDVCRLPQMPDHSYVPPAAGKKDTYRVVASFLNGTTKGSVTGGMFHPKAPPPK